MISTRVLIVWKARLPMNEKPKWAIVNDSGSVVLTVIDDDNTAKPLVFTTRKKARECCYRHPLDRIVRVVDLPRRERKIALSPFTKVG
jgi:hypothetical protein